jgi:Fe-coproporphyrin III synthase
LLESASPDHPQIGRLPLLTLYLSDRCNSRCVSCDYWRHGRDDMNLSMVRRLLPSLAQLGTRLVLLSGGEPLLNPEWVAIAETLRASGLELWLLTSGLSLVKHAARVAALFHRITVSLDGTDASTYAAIRGLDAFDNVCAGIRAVAAHGKPAGVRVTLQRANFRQFPAFVDLSKRLQAQSVSFLAVDVANPHAFGRVDDFTTDLALRPDDLPVFEAILNAAERDFSDEFRTGFIAENPDKLRRVLQYFKALHGEASYPKVRCNAPEFSAVIGATGSVQPCFFIPGPKDARITDSFARTINRASLTALRADIRAGKRVECKTCTCSLWRERIDL